MEKTKETNENNICKDISSFYNNDIAFHIGEISHVPCLYKYMPLDVALKCLKQDNLQFAEPTTWKDKYEGRFYKDKIKFLNTDKEKYHPTGPIYISCFSRVNASEPAWKVYSSDNAGVCSKCVEFKIRPRIIRETLFNFAKKNKYKFYEGEVSYFDQNTIDNLHIKGKTYHNYFFDNFTIDKYFSLLLLKRSAYDYEKEFRFFLVPNNDIQNSKKQDKIFIDNFPWIKAVSEIRYDSSMLEFEIELLKTTYDKAYNKEYHHDSSLKKAKAIIKPYDVNYMEDTDIIIEN